MIGTNAGPHELAGKMCHELFFTTSWQNDQTPEAMGKYMQDQGLTDVYVMAPNYAAGKDMITGFKRYFKGKIVDEVYTKLGQQDYQAEITQLRAKNPKAVFVFYPGGMGIQFLKQYAQAGLREPDPALLRVHGRRDHAARRRRTRRSASSRRATGARTSRTRRTQKYVADFKKKFGNTPSFYGAQSYDGIMLIDSAVRAVKGDLTNKKGMIAAMRKADYKSTRGQVHLQRQPLPDPELLPAEGRPGRGRRARDADPEDGLREPQGRLLPGVPDEVVARAAWRRRGARRRPRPFRLPGRPMSPAARRSSRRSTACSSA